MGRHQRTMVDSPSCCELPFFAYRETNTMREYKTDEIFPDPLQMTTTSIVTVVAGQANTVQGQLSGRALSSVSMNQARTVPTTGRGHQDATSAHGRVTFYNAAPYAQTVAAGTLLTGTDGGEIVT